MSEAYTNPYAPPQLVFDADSMCEGLLTKYLKRVDCEFKHWLGSTLLAGLPWVILRILIQNDYHYTEYWYAILGILLGSAAIPLVAFVMICMIKYFRSLFIILNLHYLISLSFFLLFHLGGMLMVFLYWSFI